MRFTITKHFAFSASHVLEGLREGHPCSRLHGHNYVVTVELAADKLDDRGMVVDYGDLSWFGTWLEDNLDHRHLNDVITLRSPTAENIAEYLAKTLEPVLPKLVAVTVSETPKTTARCEL